MSFMSGVWRFLGADDDDANTGKVVEYPTPNSAAKAEPAPGPADNIITMPQPPPTTVFVVKPELDSNGKPLFSMKSYARYLLTRQALVLDINAIAADDLTKAMRLVDYMAGVAEAVEGSVYEVTKNIFVFAPRNVKLAGDPLKAVEVE
jgi:FtsZ-interacting cell division protein YlmF